MNIEFKAHWRWDEYDADYDEFFFDSFAEIYANTYLKENLFHRPYTMVTIKIDQSHWIYCDDWEDIYDLEAFIENKPMP